MSGDDLTGVLRELPGALSATTKALGPDLAAAIASPQLAAGARRLLTSDDVRAGVADVASSAGWRIGLIVGGSILVAIVGGHLLARRLTRRGMP